MATFGYTSIGASNASIGADTIILCQFILSEKASVSKISMYTSSNNLATAGIYRDSSGVPSTLIKQSQQITVSASDGWNDFTFTYPVTLNPDTYWLGVNFDVTGKSFYDAGSTNQEWDKNSTYTGTLPASLSSPTAQNARKLSIYATYTSLNLNNLPENYPVYVKVGNGQSRNELAT